MEKLLLSFDFSERLGANPSFAEITGILCHPLGAYDDIIDHKKT